MTFDQAMLVFMPGPNVKKKENLKTGTMSELVAQGIIPQQPAKTLVQQVREERAAREAREARIGKRRRRKQRMKELKQYLKDQQDAGDETC